jgi:hypothetical protein
MKTTAFCLLIIFLTSVGFHSGSAQAQEDVVKDRNFKFELEPASFALRGFAGSVLYNITKDNKLALGIYGATLDVPVWSRPSIFENVGEDTSSVRLGMQIALMARYKLQLFDQWESNPYVGFIFGYEYFDVTQPSNPETVRLSTLVATPYVGYEFYFFKQMLFINPQLRAVFYAGQKTSDASRPEKIGSFFMLPQISLGVRF